MIDRKARRSCPGWAKAEAHISRDPVMREIVRRVGPCTLAPRDNYFAVLCQSIVNQQISTKVALVIYNRFRNLFPGRRPTAAALLKLTDAQLRKAGCSRSKAIYLRSLAEAFAKGSVPTRRFRSMSDEEIIASLTPIKGIGRWTAEMFLMFVLNREDVLAVDDLVLCKSAQLHYALKEYPKAAKMHELAEKWKPYRSIASWYLWRGFSKPKPGE